jgi:hypothetical protein
MQFDLSVDDVYESMGDGESFHMANKLWKHGYRPDKATSWEHGPEEALEYVSIADTVAHLKNVRGVSLERLVKTFLDN